MRSPKEGDIVNACLCLLKLRGAFAWRTNQGATKVGGRFIRFSHVKGISDIIGVLPNGQFLAVEVKRPGQGKKSKPRADQAGFLAEIEAKRGLAVCVTSVTELDSILTQAGDRLHSKHEVQ
jgi:hypothetical protein